MNTPCDIICACPDHATAKAFARRLANLPASFAARCNLIVPIGANPSLQRNEALRHSDAPYVLFLDSDVEFDAAYWARIERHVVLAASKVVGGPAVLRAGADEAEQIFHAALSHPLAVGKSASRYTPRGTLRTTTEAEVILCNLLVRRDLFDEYDVFDETLYPNEENEWLDRLPPGAITYDPELIVARPQRGDIAEFATTLARYGAGRTRQAIASCAIGPKNAPGLLAIAGTLLFLKKPKAALATGLGLFAVLTGVLAATSPNKNKDVRVGFAGALAVACYAIGQVIGLLPPKRRSRDVTVWKLEAGAREFHKLR